MIKIAPINYFLKKLNKYEFVKMYRFLANFIFLLEK